MKDELGALPLVKEEKGDDGEEKEKEKPEVSTVSTRPAILPDGTYATQSAFSVAKIVTPKGKWLSFVLLQAPIDVGVCTCRE